MIIYKPGKVSYVDLGVTLDNIENVTGQVRRFLFTGTQYMVMEYDTSTDLSELNYWDTDGSEAVSRIMEKTGILDVVFDTVENRYYALRWNNDLGFEGTSGLEWAGDTLFFDAFDVGNPVDVTRPRPSLWSEGGLSWGAYDTHTENVSGEIVEEDIYSWSLLKRNDQSNRLEYESSDGRGMIKTTASYDGDFQAWADFFMTEFPGDDSFCSMRMIDSESDSFSGIRNNLVSQASFKGAYDAAGPYGSWQSAHVYFDNDSTNSKWLIRNFRLREENDSDTRYSLTDGSYSTYSIEFSSYLTTNDTNYFTVKSPGGTALSSGVVNNTAKTFDLVDGPLAFTLCGDPSSDLGNLNGTSIQANIRLDNTPVTGDSDLTNVDGVNGFRVGVGKLGTNLYARRDNDADAGSYAWQNIRVYNMATPTTRNISVELCANCMSAATSPDLGIDNFIMEATSTGTVTWPEIPTFAVETYDTAGSLNPVTGITDSSGYAIKKLNAIRMSSSGDGSLDSIRENGIVAITSDQLSAANGGSVNILIRRFENDTPVVYRYSKSSLPLVSSVESGENAEVTASGTIEHHNQYRIGSFSYGNYSGGQLSYTTENWADSTRGAFVNTLLSGTLSGTHPRRTAWVQSTEHMAWNVNDTDSMYGMTPSGPTAGEIKLYNMTPDTAAFVNVVTSNKLLPAGTNQTSTVAGQVMNVYGEPLENKTVTFTVTAGDGALSPPSVVTNSSGVAYTTYVVGTAVTSSTITATVNI